jgi:hypothetical protein
VGGIRKRTLRIKTGKISQVQQPQLFMNPGRGSCRATCTLDSVRRPFAKSCKAIQGSGLLRPPPANLRCCIVSLVHDLVLYIRPFSCLRKH